MSPTASGLERAIDFGMSSPKTMKKYVMIAATIMMDIASLDAEMKGMGRFMRIGFITFTKVAPPIADARTATRVMPI